MMPVESAVPVGYGFVVLTALGSIMLITWNAIKVAYGRVVHNVPYPTMYTPDKVAFNCILRAQQGTLENYNQFLITLLIGGLEMPYFCTLAGIIWIAGRVSYADGYYTGEHTTKAHGKFGFVGTFMLLMATTLFAFQHLG